MAVSETVFASAVRMGTRLKVHELPPLVRHHLRGTSIVRNNRKRSWTWWDSPNGLEYQSLCDSVLKGKDQSCVFFLPAASASNLHLRRQHGRALFMSMHRNCQTRSAVKVKIYNPDDLAPDSWLLPLLLSPVGPGTTLNLLDARCFRPGFGFREDVCASGGSFGQTGQVAHPSDLVAAAAADKTGLPMGALIDMMIVDNAYVQLKGNCVPPCHSNDSAEVARWISRFQEWMDSGVGQDCFDELEHTWVNS